MRLLIDDLTLDLDARRLLRGREELHLSPKAYELFRILVDGRPRALSKRELHEQLWPETFVSETNLANLIVEIRNALGESARAPRYVRTVQRYGYAFNGQVAEQTAGRTSFCWLVLDGKRLPLRPGDNIIGRDADDGIRIESATVSRRHARIVIEADAATLEDLDSKNGTFLRDQPVTTAVSLTDGDTIGVGEVVLRFRRASRSTATWNSRSSRQRRRPVSDDGDA